jgi:ATP-dependent DNA ligase
MVYKILKELENTPGTNDKQALIELNKENEDLRQFFFMCENPNIMYGLKKIPAYDFKGDFFTLGDAMMQLYSFSSREKTGHEAIAHLKMVLEGCTSTNANVIERIIKKDADCGVGYKLVNKVWKKLIPITPYMRCASSNEKNYKRINYPAIIQKKADGLFINNIVKGGKAYHQSRNGKPMDLHGVLDAELTSMLPGKDYVVTGEGLVKDGKGGFLPRKTGNGIISKAIHGTLSPEEAKMIVIEVWDIIPFKSWEAGKFDTYDYEIRYDALLKIFTGEFSKFSVIETEIINSMDEAREYFKGMITRGEEGAILKNLSGKWKNGKSNDCVKMKIADPADLLCVGTYPHKKDPNLIGGLNLESSEGIIKVNSGSGLTDFDRQQSPDTYIGKIIEIEYNDITDDKKTGQKSLFLPIYQGIRHDKDEADSYELILERSTQKKHKKNR